MSDEPKAVDATGAPEGVTNDEDTLLAGPRELTEEDAEMLSGGNPNSGYTGGPPTWNTSPPGGPGGG